VPVARPDGEDAEARVLRYADALADGLRDAGPADVHHSEDCLSARSLLALRAEGRVPAIVRTVHHVDDFRSPVLRDCQERSILDVDHVICVSRHWAYHLQEAFGRKADVVGNGVRAEVFAAAGLGRAEAGARFGWGARPVVLSVGGIEPRKGSRTLLEAFAAARARLSGGNGGPSAPALLAIAGGETLFDYADFRAEWERDAERLGMRVHRGPRPPNEADVAVLGTIAEDDMPALYRAADVLAFPSVREGFGLVVLEALAAGLPAVVSDLPVLREHLADGRDCLMTAPQDPAALTDALVLAMTDERLRRRLATEGRRTAADHTWAACAQAHERIYERVRGGAPEAGRAG
jgi:glycosyltransferase-like protein